jgi:hypothetical protein
LSTGIGCLSGSLIFRIVLHSISSGMTYSFRRFLYYVNKRAARPVYNDTINAIKSQVKKRFFK